MESFTFGPAKRPAKQHSRKARRFAVGVVGVVLALGAGAMAAWVLIPQGAGFGYSKGANATQGLALKTLVVTADQLTGIGPSATGTAQARVGNDNTFPVSLTKVQQGPGSVQVVGDPTCTAPAGSFTMTTWTGDQPISAGGTVSRSLDVSTTAAFPGCMAGQHIQIPVLLDGAAS